VDEPEREETVGNMGKSMMCRSVVLLGGVLLGGCLPTGGSDNSGDDGIIQVGSDGGVNGADASVVNPESDAGAVPDLGTPDECEFATSQAASEPCCLAHGVDACGAELFCAAFDGRQQPTCYVEGVRASGEQCGADAHCLSDDCHPELGVCLGSGGEACTPEVGCSAALGDDYVYCDGGRCEESRGRVGDPCGENRHCDDGLCEGGLCARVDPCARVCTTFAACAVQECPGIEPGAHDDAFASCLQACDEPGVPLLDVMESLEGDCEQMVRFYSQIGGGFAETCRGD
jgi:hypothetical protein